MQYPQDVKAHAPTTSKVQRAVLKIPLTIQGREATSTLFEGSSTLPSSLASLFSNQHAYVFNCILLRLFGVADSSIYLALGVFLGYKPILWP